MLSGWVKIYRSIQNSNVTERGATRLGIVVNLILDARVSPGFENGIFLERGQLVASYRSLAQKYGVSVKILRTTIEHLKNTGFLTTHNIICSNGMKTIYTILNYDKFQGAKTEICEPEGTPSGTPSGTPEKNDNENINVSKSNNCNINLRGDYNMAGTPLGTPSGTTPFPYNRRMINNINNNTLSAPARAYAWENPPELDQLPPEIVSAWNNWMELIEYQTGRKMLAFQRRNQFEKLMRLPPDIRLDALKNSCGFNGKPKLAIYDPRIPAHRVITITPDYSRPADSDADDGDIMSIDEQQRLAQEFLNND